MEKIECLAFAKWVMSNVAQDLGDSDDNRWAYIPRDTQEIHSLTDDELWEKYIQQKHT